MTTSSTPYPTRTIRSTTARRTLLAWLLAAASGAAPAQHASHSAPASQAADNYPNRAVVLVVPTAAAGGTDTIARILGEGLSKTLGQPFVVENRPGANGTIGANAVAQAAPDGYRLLFTYAAAMAVSPGMYRKLPYHPTQAFAPIAQVGRGGNLLLVNNDLPVSSVRAFVEYVKARPGQLSYCSWGQGSGGHLTMEHLLKQTGGQMLHVPYKGSAPCVQDLIAGQVHAAFGDTSSTIELVRAGRMRVLAHSGSARLALYPDLPSLTEAGYPFNIYSWYGFFAPAHTPQPIIDKLNAAINHLLQAPDTAQRLAQLNMTDLPHTTPQQFAATLQQDIAAWGQLIRELDLPLQ